MKTILSTFLLTVCGFSVGHSINDPCYFWLPTRTVLNLSTRTAVAPEGVLIGGVNAEKDQTILLVRAVGPGLADFGVDGVMEDPVLSVFIGGRKAFANDNWESPNSTPVSLEEYSELFGIEEMRVNAFPLAPGSKDAAFIVHLRPGAYTFHIRDKSNSGGEVLLEVYDLYPSGGPPPPGWRPLIWPQTPIE